MAIARALERHVEDEERPARDVDRGVQQRLVHRHEGRPVADDPALVAERLAQRLAEADADVLHRVVESTSRSPLASTGRSISPCLDHASSMWLKNGMPVSTLRAAGAVDVQLEDDLASPWCCARPGSAAAPPAPCSARRRSSRSLPRGRDAYRRRRAVSVEAFHARQLRRRAAAPPPARRRVLDHARAASRSPRSRAPRRSARCRRSAARGSVPPRSPPPPRACGARGTPRPRAAPARSRRLGIRDLQLQVLGSEPVGQLHRLLEARGQHERAVARRAPRPRSRGAAARRAGGRARPRPRPRSAGEGVSSTARAIGSCSAWASRSAATNAASALSSATTTTSLGPATMSMPDVAEDLALGERHVDVAGAHDLVHAADGLGAVGQRGDRLGAAHPVGLGHARDARGGQHRGIERPSAAGGETSTISADPGHPRRHHRHQHGGRIGGAPARDVDRDPVERPHLLAEHASRCSSVMRQERGAHSRVEALDALGRVAAATERHLAHRALGRRDTRPGRTASSAAGRATRSKRAVQSSSAASPLARTAATISTTRARSSGSTAEGGRSSGADHPATPSPPRRRAGGSSLAGSP